MSEWQDIKTAPRDGRFIWLFREGYEPTIGYYDPAGTVYGWIVMSPWSLSPITLPQSPWSQTQERRHPPVPVPLRLLLFLSRLPLLHDLRPCQ